ncbi:MAG: DUF2093 domain-containing protein [Caulobacteraceae bacterium]|nr:MAG: DUF2093 domain-containing protein [Caulobacteraceae bacterium]
MNAFDPHASDLAVLDYGDGDFRVVKPGRYVLCAVSGAKIPLEALRYWNPERQEAYASPKEALARYREVGVELK